MTARDAGGNAGTQAPQGPSFIRRHPILAAFGVLAALSLFAAYWPVSAVVTGALVGARASGIDRIAFQWARRGAAAAMRRLHRIPEPPSGPPAACAPEPHGPGAPPVASPRPDAPGPARRAPAQPQAHTRTARPPAVREAGHRATRRLRREPARTVAGAEERDLGL